MFCVAGEEQEELVKSALDSETLLLPALEEHIPWGWVLVVGLEEWWVQPGVGLASTVVVVVVMEDNPWVWDQGEDPWVLLAQELQQHLLYS